ncbi:MAG: L28 family ribosomal protein [Patescibacteria group bacterium]
MKCYFCEKVSIMGMGRKKLRGKYNPTEKTKKHPNLQWAKLPAGSLLAGKRIKACTRCIKTLTKSKS